jgi:putative toxin-antitoxin system antitoxin component (TIGR02293 family)
MSATVEKKGVTRRPAKSGVISKQKGPSRARLRAHAKEPLIEKTGKAVDSSFAVLGYLGLYLEEPLLQIDAIKRGVPAITVKRIAGDLNIDQGGFLHALNLSTATINRRVAKAEKLPVDEGERVVGLARLVGQVEAMVKDSGNPEGFNAAEWLSRWLREPLPALGGRMPIDLLDTMSGQALVSQALSRLQSGSYA